MLDLLRGRGPRKAPASAKARPGRAGSTPETIGRVVSWNMLRSIGADLADLEQLIRRERPDILLLQEVTAGFESICDRVGGFFVRAQMPGRIHGLAVWSRLPLPQVPTVTRLPPGAVFQRICQIVELDGFALVNVHLSHGQMLNRRQLRRIAGLLPDRVAILGDFNIVGPHLVPEFRDVGPRLPTHRMVGLVPLRLDRCLVRGLVCTGARVLPRRRSDHCPIAVDLGIDRAWQGARPKPGLLRGRAWRVAHRRRAGA
jgi:endonuclease/exonuclease/phosphatase family metal-dependent hydrolase